MFKDFSRRLLDATGGDGGAGDGGAAAAAAAAAAATPWHAGKVDAETMGFWQNKGYDITDPIKVATSLTQQYREAEKFVGVPAAELVRLPKNAADEAGWNAVYQRLGAPKTPAEYDFSTVKHADGNAPDAALLDAVRATAAAVRAPKDRAPEIANAVVKYLDGVKAEQKAVAEAKINQERADLAKSWGPQFEMNKLAAMQGANQLGISREALNALENVAGYGAVMEAMRRIGMGRSEDLFFDSGKAGGTPPTAEAAGARLQELYRDNAWVTRLMANDSAARREFDSLSMQINSAA